MWKRAALTSLALGVALVSVVFLSIPGMAGASGATTPAEERPSRPLRIPSVGADAVVPGEYIVKYRSGVSEAAAADVPRSAGARRVDHLDLINADVVRLSEATAANSMAALLSSPLVEYVVPNSVLEADSLPNDPDLPKLWGLNSTNPADPDIDAPEAWNITQGSSDIVIAVIDSGTDIYHPDLVNRIYTNTREVPNNNTDDDMNGYVDDVHGWDFYFNDNTVYDGPTDDHGTHVSGTIAATANNAEGIVGVAPSVRILPLKFLGPSGRGYTDDAVKAIQYARMMGARVINASWGGGGYWQPLADAIALCDCVFVAAAGNSGENLNYAPHYPASLSLPNLIAVAAVDPNGGLAAYSNYGGGAVDLAAPGSSIYSTVPRFSRGAGAFIGGASSSISRAVTHGFGLSMFPDAADRTAVVRNTMTMLGVAAADRILLVDDDSADSGTYDVRSTYVEALQSAGFTDVTTVNVEPFMDGPSYDLPHYRVVIWMSGYASPAYGVEVLTENDRAALHGYLEDGGRLWLSGAYIVWTDNSADQFIVGDLGLWTTGVVDDLGVMMGREGTSFAGAAYAYNQEEPYTELTLLRDDAQVHLRYQRHNVGDYGYMSGTSMATPHVTGIAALVLSKVPVLSPIEVVSIIEQTVEKTSALPTWKVRAGGIANAHKALELARPPYAILWGHHETPLTVGRSQTVTVPVTLTNRGTKFWWSGTNNGSFFLSYQWKDSQNRTVGTPLYTPVPVSVAPDRTVTINAQLKAPDEVGTYTLVWDMVEKGVTWFSAKGVEPLTVSVTVNNPYDIRWDGHSSPSTLQLNETATVSLTLTNMGSKSWAITGENPVYISYRWKNRVGTVLSAPPLYTLLPKEVPPGQSVTVNAQVKAPSDPGPFTLSWDLVEKNVTWFSDRAAAPLSVPVTIGIPYSANWESQDTPATMIPGQAVLVHVTLRNMGSKIWPCEGANPVLLLYRWKNAAGEVVGASHSELLPYDIWPGSRVTLAANVTPPSVPGIYTLEWDLWEQDVTLFSAQGVSTLTKTVNVGRRYDVRWDSHSTPRVLGVPGQTVTVPLAFTNMGTKPWPITGANPMYVSYRWKDSTGKVIGTPLYTLLPKAVSQGESVTVNAQLRAPASYGAYTLEWDLVEKSVTWFSAQQVPSLVVPVHVSQPYNIQWGTVATPASLNPGQVTTVPVSLTNVGSKTWTNTGPNPVQITYRWKNTAGTVVWPARNTTLPHVVSPGQSVTVNATLEAPAAAGFYTLEWDLVEKDITRFSTKGVAMHTTTVTVGQAYGVRWDNHNTPTTVGPPGQTMTVDLVFTNAGSKEWPITGVNPVYVSYRWKDSTGKVTGTPLYTLLPQAVAPGQSVSMKAQLRTPASTGLYTLEWDLVEKSVTWFSAKGVASLTVPVTVTSPYGVQWGTVNPPAIMGPGQIGVVTVSLTNTGSKTWVNTGLHPIEILYLWKNASGAVVGAGRKVLPQIVGPGESLSVTHQVEAPNLLGQYTLEWDLVERDITRFSSKGVPTLQKSVYIAGPYEIRWESHDTPTAVSTPGQLFSVNLSLTNIGTKRWLNTGDHPVLVSYWWRNSSGATVGTQRYTYLPHEVAPGGSVTVTAQVVAPPTAGEYTLEWDLVEKNVTWFSWYGARLLRVNVSVSTSQAGVPYSVQWNSHNTPAAMTSSQAVVVNLSLTNTGTKHWPVTGANPIYISYRWKDSNNNVVGTELYTLLPQAAAPGETVTVAAQLQAPSAPGTYTLEWDLVEKDVTWFAWQGVQPLATTVTIN